MAGNIPPWSSILMRTRDFMPFFAAIAIDKDGTIKPTKPLNADQLRRRSGRKAATQQKVRDENARQASRVRDLQGRLPPHPAPDRRAWRPAWDRRAPAPWRGLASTGIPPGSEASRDWGNSFLSVPRIDRSDPHGSCINLPIDRINKTSLNPEQSLPVRD